VNSSSRIAPLIVQKWIVRYHSWKFGIIRVPMWNIIKILKSYSLVSPVSVLHRDALEQKLPEAIVYRFQNEYGEGHDLITKARVESTLMKSHCGFIRPWERRCHWLKRVVVQPPYSFIRSCVGDVISWGRVRLEVFSSASCRIFLCYY